MDDIIICGKRFAGESHRLRDWVTPDAIEVQLLFDEIGTPDPEKSLIACWNWISDNISYPTNHLGRMVDSHELISFSGAQHYINSSDMWLFPCETIARAKLARRFGHKSLGDCDDVALCLVSLLRNQFSPQDVYCVVGDYLSRQPTGHAWVKCRLDGDWIIVDPTVALGAKLDLSRYDEYVLFNDVELHELRSAEEILGGCSHLGDIARKGSHLTR